MNTKLNLPEDYVKYVDNTTKQIHTLKYFWFSLLLFYL